MWYLTSNLRAEKTSPQSCRVPPDMPPFPTHPKKHQVLLGESLLRKDPLNSNFSNSIWAHHDEVVLKFRLNINCWKLETAQKVYVSLSIFIV